MPLPERINAYKSWANAPDRPARTAPARSAFQQKFLTDADGDPQRAEALRKAYYLGLAQKSAESRRRTKAAREAKRQAHIAALLGSVEGMPS
jgi:hypothetical protein